MFICQTLHTHFHMHMLCYVSALELIIMFLKLSFYLTIFYKTVLQSLLDVLLPLCHIRAKQRVILSAATSGILAATHLREELYCKAIS